MERGHVLFREIIVNDKFVIYSFYDCYVPKGRDARPVRPPVRMIRMFVCGNASVCVRRFERSRRSIRTFMQGNASVHAGRCERSCVVRHGI